MGKPLYRRVIPETYVQLLYEYLENQGHNPELILGEPWPILDPHGLGGVPMAQWEHLLEHARQKLGDPLLGLHVGQMISTRHLGVLGTVLHACGNLGEALKLYERYQRLIFDVTPMTTERNSNWIELTWDLDEYHISQLAEETGMVVMLQFCRNLIRGKGVPLMVSFYNAEPDNIYPYEEYFGCPILFNQQKSSIRVDVELLTRPLKSPDPALITLLERHIDELLNKLPQENEIIEKIRREIAHLLCEGEPNIEKLSTKFYCTPRTLQRRLNSAGTNFRKELNVVRFELARDYLRDPRLQIAEIAQLLGYSEHSAFTRAYREWMGKTPQQERDLFLALN